MRKFIAMLTGIALVLLCGCGEGISAPDLETMPSEAATIAYVPLPLPTHEGTAMPPLQGGPMLYPFPGNREDIWETTYGLINQNGEVVAQRQYDFYPQYVYGDAARTLVIGLVASQRLDEETFAYTYYNLDGTAKKLACEGARQPDIIVFPGGRFAVVNTGAWDKRRAGLLDIEANAWAMEPVDGAWFNGTALVDREGNIIHNIELLDQDLQSVFTGEPSDTFRALPNLHIYGLGLNHEYYVDGYYGSFYDAKIVKAYEDYILISGWQNLFENTHEGYTEPMFFAIDWDGNLYPDCPLQLYYDSVKLDTGVLGVRLTYSYSWSIAGPQGPNYYWVEHNGQRGYIDTAGNWLFIDE